MKLLSLLSLAFFAVIAVMANSVSVRNFGNRRKEYQR